LMRVRHFCLVEDEFGIGKTSVAPMSRQFRSDCCRLSKVLFFVAPCKWPAQSPAYTPGLGVQPRTPQCWHLGDGVVEAWLESESGRSHNARAPAGHGGQAAHFLVSGRHLGLPPPEGQGRLAAEIPCGSGTRRIRRVGAAAHTTAAHGLRDLLGVPAKACR